MSKMLYADEGKDVERIAILLEVDGVVQPPPDGEQDNVSLLSSGRILARTVKQGLSAQRREDGLWYIDNPRTGFRVQSGLTDLEALELVAGVK